MLCVLFAMTGGASSAADSSEAVATAVRAQLKKFEEAWNRGDLAASVADDDPSLVGILGSSFLDYAGVLQAAREMLAKRDPSHIRIEVNLVRSLGQDYALANGHVYARGADGQDRANPFTVIYVRRQGKWKLVYSHS